MEEYNITEILHRYEEMLRNGKSVYFDSDEFEDIADYYDSQEDTEASLRVVEEGLKQHPGNQVLLMKKIRILILKGEYDKASSLIDGISADSFDSEILLFKAEIFVNTNNIQAGLSIFDMLSEQSNDEYIFLEISDILKSVELFTDANNYLQKGLKKFPQSLELLREVADNYRLSGNYDDAIPVYNDILDIDPYSSDDWTDLGELYSIKADYEKAIEAFDFSLAIDETDERTIYMKGNCLILNGNYEKAIETLLEYAEFNSEDETPYILIAECYEEMQNLDAAYEYCQKAIEKNDKSVLAYKKMIYFLMEQSRFNEALLYADKALRVTQEDSNLYFLKADILTTLNDYIGALDSYKSAIKISTDKDEKTDILYSVGVLKQKENNDDEAILFFEQVEEFKPDYPDLFLKMAVSYYEIKQYDKCAEYLEKASAESTINLSIKEIQNREGIITQLTQLLQQIN